MPYRSKAERERPNWMTLRQAVVHVAVAEKCEPGEALHQLRLALGEADIPARWAADPPPLIPGMYSVELPEIFSPEQVPRDARYWGRVTILLSGDCRVLHQSEEQSLPSPRELLLLISRVLELWSNPTPFQLSMGHREDAGLGYQANRRATTKQIREVAREVYASQDGKPPNTNEAETRVREKLPKASRKFIREVLKETEFANLRLKPGKQPKH
jgi:hypothetical protein